MNASDEVIFTLVKIMNESAAKAFNQLSFSSSSDFVLVGVILLSNKYKVNPDNMATPLAASIGDVVCLTLLSLITSTLYANLGMHALTESF